jgi:hypothetical protein
MDIPNWRVALPNIDFGWELILLRRISKNGIRNRIPYYVPSKYCYHVFYPLAIRAWKQSRYFGPRLNFKDLTGTCTAYSRTVKMYRF